MRRIAWVVLVLVVLTVVGCQWAKFSEAWKGPQAGVSKDTPATDARVRYVPVGTGRWVDAAGREHTGTVYARVGPEGVRGPEGERGPEGPPSAKDGKVEILDTPARHAVTYEADSGTYRRETTVIAPPWGSDPAKTVSAIKPFQAEGLKLPDFRNDGMDLRGGGGSFSGGGMESITDVVRRGPILLCAIGGLAVLGGIVLAVWAKRVTLGLAVAGGGGGLIAAGVLFEVYPWVLLIALAAVLGVGVWWLVDAKFAGKAKSALSAIVRGVEAAPEDAQTAVKDSIASAATATGQYAAVKDTISQAKAKAGVG